MIVVTENHSSDSIFFLRIPQPPRPTLFPYTTLFRSRARSPVPIGQQRQPIDVHTLRLMVRQKTMPRAARPRSEEHTSELQSRRDLVCRLLLEKKKIVKLIRLLCCGNKW